ncbi:hypothetical protein MMC13_007054 [Lambiella insularis]|nr:hypothetical protein [Lambiella insularis]
MLRAWALNDLFTENTDEIAKGIILTTVGGNLGSKDAVTSNLKAKRASALGSLTWRVNCALALGSDSAGIARVKPLPTIKVHAHENELKSIVADLDGEALAFAYVHEGLLVGIFGGKVDGMKEKKDEDEQEEVEEEAEEGVQERWSNLEWKAAAMADHLRTELRDFKMPTGLD